MIKLQISIQYARRLCMIGESAGAGRRLVLPRWGRQQSSAGNGKRDRMGWNGTFPCFIRVRTERNNCFGKCEDAEVVPGHRSCHAPPPPPPQATKLYLVLTNFGRFTSKTLLFTNYPRPCLPRSVSEEMGPLVEYIFQDGIYRRD